MLPANMLSYVEHYDPQYFLLENVAGLLNFPLMSTEEGRSLKGGIKSGVVKLIMRTLIALGYVHLFLQLSTHTNHLLNRYQVRYKLLQAGQYGAPQGRQRVIFWGAKRGLSMPDFPVPVYAYPKGARRSTLTSGDFLEPMSRSLSGGSHQWAPFKAITVNDAISDLVC